ncbi:MAG TPA: class I SAM-dependent methyltransferase [Acidimicrobiales bacterium]|nr:class I SAM-dependent methyltransferase [Acidimicrobiales bacterium]
MAAPAQGVLGRTAAVKVTTQHGPGPRAVALVSDRGSDDDGDRSSSTYREVRLVRVTARSTRHYRDSPNAFARELFAPLPPRYDALATLLSFGQDPRWRAAMVERVVAARPALILDVACGPGAVTRRLVRETSARVVGLDLSEPMLRQGAAVIASAGLGERVALVVGRGEQLPFPDATFDALTFTYLLRYVEDPAATLAELARVVKPGGPVASLEFAVPERLGWRLAWWAYTRAALPTVGYVVGGRAWWNVGRFLGPSISAHYRRYPVPWTVRAWHNAGIIDVEARRMSLGGGLVISGIRSDD